MSKLHPIAWAVVVFLLIAALRFAERVTRRQARRRIRTDGHGIVDVVKRERAASKGH